MYSEIFRVCKGNLWVKHHFYLPEPHYRAVLEPERFVKFDEITTLQNQHAT